MKTLLLLRHAKSSWDNTGLKDFDRPLNERGQEAAPLIGKAMRKRKLQPDLIISSPAVRAKETTQLVRDAAGLTPKINYEEGIYEASTRNLLEIVSRIDDSVHVAMMVGHNPGFEELLTVLTGETKRMPTAALALIELNIEKWSEVSSGRGTLIWLIKPKDLK
jgi:phosphohistidine phosphatase